MYWAGLESHPLEVLSRYYSPDPLAIASLFLCSYVTGVINRDKYHAFERVMWRGTRGNVYMRNVDIDEPLKDPVTVSIWRCERRTVSRPSLERFSFGLTAAIQMYVAP